MPGCALRLSAAPPTTIVIELPGPFFRIFEQDCFDTEHMPMARMMSRYIGIRKLLASVSRWGIMPGNAAENPVPREET